MTIKEKLSKKRKEIRRSAVGLTNRIIEHKQKYNQDMTQEILLYMKEKLKGETKT